ncbi:MAG: RlmE family RNA methyltransferase [Deltaproteobacteria bacterium]|nr:RlmE family RNA methyltransferase [Deltaproteobacteria bacterium]
MAKPYVRKDRFFQEAKAKSFAARSVFKLEEIDERLRLFKRGDRIIDLGCAPGSWLQYLTRIAGPKGMVIGYDLAPLTVSPGPNARFYQVDILTRSPEQIMTDLGQAVAEQKRHRADRKAQATQEGRAPASDQAPAVVERTPGEQTDGAEAIEHPASMQRYRIDAVVSDMAPKLSGVRDADQARSLGLASHALGIARALVGPRGCFVAKVFQGRDLDAFLLEVKGAFKQVKVIRPEATREGSRESFVIGRELKPIRGKPTDGDASA